jgi:hypothetical protein
MLSDNMFQFFILENFTHSLFNKRIRKFLFLQSFEFLKLIFFSYSHPEVLLNTVIVPAAPQVAAGGIEPGTEAF